MQPVTLDTKLPRDHEERRLLAAYKASSDKECAAADQVLNPRSSLPLRAYLELVGDLRVIRTECNEKRLAVKAYREKTQDR
jgi:hypothetical protein